MEDGLFLLEAGMGRLKPCLFFDARDQFHETKVLFSMNQVIVQTDEAQIETAHDGFETKVEGSLENDDLS
jgi:hypothetical protein